MQTIFEAGKWKKSATWLGFKTNPPPKKNLAEEKNMQGFKSLSKNPKYPKNPKFVFIFLEDPKKYLKTPKTPNKPQLFILVEKPLLILWFWSYFLYLFFFPMRNSEGKIVLLWLSGEKNTFQIEASYVTLTTLYLQRLCPK